jgi:hypothetical protein
MKSPRSILLAALLLFASILNAQNKEAHVLLKGGSFLPNPNITKQVLDSFHKSAPRFLDKAFAVIQFTGLPSDDLRRKLSAEGIELLEYIPANSYTVSIKGKPGAALLQAAGAQALFSLHPAQKMHPWLAEGRIPSWAQKVYGTADCWLSFAKTFTPGDVIHELNRLGFTVTSSNLSSYRILHVQSATNRLSELAALPFIEYVQPAPPEDRPLNYNSRSASRANVLQASAANGGRGLKGEGVVIGIGDNADVQTHADFSGRLINRAAANAAGHGHHVHGTAAGAGNINELYTGFAPKATIVSQAFFGIIKNAGVYVQDYGMVLTNNSYGNIDECDYHGTYDLYSRLLDQQAFDLPSLQHVFSAGNSGNNTCAPYATGFRTVLGGYQSAKNVLTVGATTDSGAVSNFSSKGPVKDGRTKPEIVSMGQFVASAWPSNIYSYNNGTSMASPAVTGGLALLYQRYRQLNGGANPKSGLMKAILCNGAADRGAAGPDFSYGFGWMNLLRSVEMLEGNRYFNTSVTQSATNTHNITVPANTAHVKVMLYWHDPAASLIAARTLVNDLDLEVVDASAAVNLPRVLDTTVQNITLPSVTGADHINNMEQVVLTNPAAGSYTIRVKGTAITQNPSQEYFVVYDVVPVQLKITSPIGGEGWAPSTNAFDMMKIAWEADGFTSGTVRLEYSMDNGATWIQIASGININRRTYTWWVPNVSSGQVLVRITREATGETTTSNRFAITGLPAVSLAPTQCEGYISVNWTAVAGAQDYEVMMLQGDEMRTIATTTATTYTIGGLSRDSLYWVTVRVRVSGLSGRRPQAISRQPATGTCVGTLSDGDLKMNAILSPVSGRRFTSTSLSAGTSIQVQVKNLDDAAVSSFTVQYSINGSTPVTETITTSLPGGATYNHTFSTTANLSIPGQYNLVVVVKNVSGTDPVPRNDTLVSLVKQLDNQPVDLAAYFLDNLETAAAATYNRDTTGLQGLDRYDFENGTAFGRLRTFVNTGIAWSGNRAITIDADRFYNPGNINYLYGTFNLAPYNTAANDLRLDFRYNQHHQPLHNTNMVWIRGSDTQPWIPAYDLDSAQGEPGFYIKSGSIELSDLLAAAGQALTSSFGVRWGQFGQLPVTDKEIAAGYTFDDIRLYQVFNDLQMIRIDTPVSVSCGLTTNVPVTVSVRNSANNTLTVIPVRYRINGGAWVVENIPSIAGNTTIQYTFTSGANLSAIGTYTIQAVVDYPSDSFRENDTTSQVVINSPVIVTFPYLESFEAGNGFWYGGGKRSSWEWGTPASSKISRATNGSRAWKTRLAGNYNDQEYSYLYSPCFDLTGMTVPTLSFSVAMDLEDCGTQFCDGAWVEYSLDGITWSKLGAAGTGTNWYNKSTDQLWSIQNDTRWHVATIPLPLHATRMRLRFVLVSDEALNREGFALDDVHVYDNRKGIYTGATPAAPVTQSVSGNSWIDFESNGQLVASLHPRNQALGTTSVQAYIHTAAVRFTTSQYYHNRNLVIKPSAPVLSDSVRVRFYFLDSEVRALQAATGCTACSKPAHAYELGVSQYSDPDDGFENGTIADNQQGIWNFIAQSNRAIVPFDRGYYAEFSVAEFSEFWLNGGGLDRSTPLPVKMLEFTARKNNGTDVLLTWKVGSESNVVLYEIEVARGDAELQSGRFTRIGSIVGAGNTTGVRTYSFTDEEDVKSGPRYYRLKIIEADGSFRYSPVRVVLFDDAVLWRIFPNPSGGKFNLVFRANTGTPVTARLYDAKGSLVAEYNQEGTGFLQKLSIDLAAKIYADGVYLLRVNNGESVQSFKLFKQ